MAEKEALGETVEAKFDELMERVEEFLGTSESVIPHPSGTGDH